MPTVNFGSFSKRRNSTKQPGGLSDSRNCKLKETTSIDAPTFIIQGNDFNYNYAEFEGRYYFITDIRSVHNNLTEVDCIVDVLATYKSEILASQQYVCYSANGNNTWLPDTRIATENDVIVTKNNVAVPLFSLSGCYILTVVGTNGVESFNVTSGIIASICADLAQWTDDIQDAIEQVVDTMDPSGSDPFDAIVHLGEMFNTVAIALIKTGFLGNSREEALSCIRSCVWLPFDRSTVGGAEDDIYLGKYPTQKKGLLVTNIPKTNTVTVNIPWHFSDYRRGTNEDLYLYLPFVGIIPLSSSSLARQASHSITYSYCVDGSLSYEVKAGNQVIGTYGGNVAGNVPVGTSQVEGLGKIFTTTLGSFQKTMSAGISAAGGNLGAATEFSMAGQALTNYEIINTGMTTHSGAIGGVTCSAGAGLDKDIVCFSVAHPTNIDPAQMAATMGRPMQAPATLGSLSGFCQCTNAHVEAAAMSTELDQIDAFLNTGFYIE